MDKIIRCITSDGSIMASAIVSTDIVATAQQVHNLSPVATAALGRLLTGASLMGAQLKQQRAALTLRIKGDGPIGALVASANSNGNVRGFAENPGCRTDYYDNGKLNVSNAVGKNGYLYVVRDYGTGDPYNGVVELVSGEIAEDITSYYANSEQIPTVCALGVLVDKEDGGVLLAGGMLIQLLPGATTEIAEKLEANIGKLESVTTMLAKGISTLDMCKLALDGFEVEVLDEMPVNYYCTCSRARVEHSFATLQDEQLRDMVNSNGNVEAVCHYCNKKYIFTEKEIEAFISQRKASAEKK
ncbi:MAG: Hsp33 family molecular chaperone HslO [Acutalibacteraceae bacterium]|nr:Hsp33 family molecular chaperone HslO [Acutalibacteraceae bacterium]